MLRKTWCYVKTPTHHPRYCTLTTRQYLLEGVLSAVSQGFIFRSEHLLYSQVRIPLYFYTPSFDNILHVIRLYSANLLGMHLWNFWKDEPMEGKSRNVSGNLSGNFEPKRLGPESRIVPLDELLVDVLVSDVSDLWLHTSEARKKG